MNAHGLTAFPKDREFLREQATLVYHSHLNWNYDRAWHQTRQRQKVDLQPKILESLVYKLSPNQD